MSIINRFKSAAKAFTAPDIIIDPSTGKKSFFMNAAKLGLFDLSSNIDTKTVEGQLKAFNNCSAVSTVVSRKVRAHLNGKYWMLDDNEKEVKNDLTKTISKLFDYPNCLQSWQQFEAQAKIYIQIFGECFILTIAPEGFAKKKDITSMWVLPNWIVSRKSSGKLYYQNDINKIIEGYTISTGNESSSDGISPDKIINIKDFFVSSTSLLNSQSRLVSLSDPVNNVVSAYNARKVLIKKRGAIGILSNTSKDKVGPIPLRPDEKVDLQKDFQRYGLSEDQWQVIITNAGLTWQSMTFPTKELMLFEEIEDSTRAIADAYEYPMFLLGFKSGTTFSNVGEAKKTLYQDCIIPEANTFIESFNKFFDCQANGFKIKVFFDHLDIFQKSLKDKAEGLKMMNDAFMIAFQNGIVTREEWRIAIDYEATKFEGNTFYEPVNQNQNGSGQQ